MAMLAKLMESITIKMRSIIFSTLSLQGIAFAIIVNKSIAGVGSEEINSGVIGTIFTIASLL
ncbi:hypothetical protein [Delftia sp. K82]|uniref:hypothetical protein n=1 Tax=Delftia sp. K82 TaxID=1472718 RepID=UPI0015C62CB3|nr:hypothetical protein [Delftia sp. K82]